MRVRGFLAAIIVAAAIPASFAPAHAATSAFRKVAEYDIGFGRITGLDVDGRSLYLMSSRRIQQGGRLARFKLQTGERIWASRVLCPGWGPQALDSFVFTQGTGCPSGLGNIGSIYAVHARNGETAFTTQAHSGLVADGAAYLTAFGDATNQSSGLVRAYDRKGHVQWETDLGGQTFALRILAAGDNVVYILDDFGVVALSGTDGSTLWRRNLGSTEQFADLHGIASDGTLLFSGQTPGSPGAGGESKPFTLAMSSSTGETVWSSDGRLGDAANGIEYETADSDLVDNVFLVARSIVDGSVVWSATAQYASGFAHPMVDAGVVWVRTIDDAATPEFRRFDAADGTVVGRVPWRNIVGLEDGLVFVPRPGDRVLAFEPV
jgi:outer membrane protein assembly factor BamB